MKLPDPPWLTDELRERARSEIAVALGRKLTRQDLRAVDALLQDGGMYSGLELLDRAQSPEDLQRVLKITRVLDRLVPNLDTL